MATRQSISFVIAFIVVMMTLTSTSLSFTGALLDQTFKAVMKGLSLLEQQAVSNLLWTWPRPTMSLDRI